MRQPDYPRHWTCPECGRKWFADVPDCDCGHHWDSLPDVLLHAGGKTITLHKLELE